MLALIGLSGSLRRGSFSSAVLRAAASLMPADSELLIETIAGIPQAVARLKEAIAAADGLLLVTPEYNNSIPGVAKNAIDSLSRPPADSARIFRGKPVALAGASPGNFATVLAQNAWLPVFRTLGADLCGLAATCSFRAQPASSARTAKLGTPRRARTSPNSSAASSPTCAHASRTVD